MTAQTLRQITTYKKIYQKITLKKVTEIRSEVVAIVGLGYVGLPLALLTERRGYNVLGIDADKNKIASLNSGQLPFRAPELHKRFTHLSRFVASNDFVRVRVADVVIVCVPTPIDGRNEPDLEPLRSACASLAPWLQSNTLVIIESTIYPGTIDDVVKPILEGGSGLRAGQDFSLAHCPERINPGDSFWRVDNIARVVGGIDEQSTTRAVEFYRSILKGTDIKPMASAREAEAVKMVENAFRDVNIAFVNELAQLFAKLNIDFVNVIDGAATKPFAFMPHYPGCGVGGHCIPVDPYYLISLAREKNVDLKLLSSARQINEAMPTYLVQLTNEVLTTRGLKPRQATVAVLGLSYKPNVDDVRESPAFEVIKELTHQGYKIRTYDPYVSRGSSAQSLDEALDRVDAAVIVTAHDNFIQELTPDLAKKYGLKAVIDGRNCLPAEAFVAADISYVGIGR